ncbi:MAG: hypothetical protein UMV23_05175, partial [Halanaerobium sp.]|nr:hypothetical protein [Halanaerobium sp.]
MDYVLWTLQYGPWTMNYGLCTMDNERRPWMEIRYIGYHDNLFKEAINQEEPRVYVFANFKNMLQAKEHYQRPFLEQESVFLTLQDFKEKLFPTDRLILREEKLAVIFYELLTAEEKDELEIDDYFSAIDLANEFFRFYAELKEYQIKQLGGLRDWQRQKIETLNNIRERYIARMEELNYSDRTLALDFGNFTTSYLSNHEEIIFVNKVDFTPLEKELIRRIEAAGKKVSLVLQLAEDDYDREN